MLRSLFSAALLLTLLSNASSGFAQDAPAAAQQSVRVTLKDGAFRRRGVMMQIEQGKIKRMTAPLTLSNGTVVHPDGRVVTSQGTQELADGRAVNMQGEVVGLSDDMLTASTIEQLDHLITGYTGTPIEILSKMPTDVEATLRRLEQKAAVLQQLTNTLAERTRQAVPTSEESARLDAELSALEAKLKP